MLLHSFIFYSISLHGIACHFIVLYGIAWYCIVFGFFARHRTVMYRCYSAPANYRVVHLVILTIDPKGALGSQNNVEQVAEVSEEIWRFLKKFCEPSLSNLLPPAQAFSNLATRWGSSMPDQYNLC